MAITCSKQADRVHACLHIFCRQRHFSAHSHVARLITHQPPMSLQVVTMFLNNSKEFGSGSTMSLSKVIQILDCIRSICGTVLTKKGSCTESTNLHGLQYAQASVDPFQMHLEE
jgi:hypothetical protein